MISRRTVVAFLAILPWALSHPLHAEPAKTNAALASFQKAATGFAYLKADFLMQKQSASVNAVLESRGEVLFARDLGLIWHVHTPFESTQVFLKDKTLLLEEGKVVSSEDRGTNASVFQAVSDAIEDPEDALRTQFFVEGVSEDKQWELRLEPRQESMRQFMIEILLKGSEHLDTWTLYRTERDWTRVRFTHVRKSTRIPEDVLVQFQRFP